MSSAPCALKIQIAFDAHRGEARPGQPEQWAAQYQMGKSARFDVSLYTAAGSACMARTWCAKMQLFYDIWCQGVDAAYVYSAEDIQAWKEPKDFTALASEMSNPKALERVRWLRGLAPQHTAARGQSVYGGSSASSGPSGGAGHRPSL